MPGHQRQFVVATVTIVCMLAPLSVLAGGTNRSTKSEANQIQHLAKAKSRSNNAKRAGAKLRLNTNRTRLLKKIKQSYKRQERKRQIVEGLIGKNKSPKPAPTKVIGLDQKPSKKRYRDAKSRPTKLGKPAATKVMAPNGKAARKRGRDAKKKK